jgi:hypothetical protein
MIGKICAVYPMERCACCLAGPRGAGFITPGPRGSVIYPAPRPRSIILAVPRQYLGSTQVPGLAAKSILDIAVVAESAAHDVVATALLAIDCLDRDERSGRHFIRGYRHARRQGMICTHDLHLHAPGNERLLRRIVLPRSKIEFYIQAAEGKNSFADGQRTQRLYHLLGPESGEERMR